MTTVWVVVENFGGLTEGVTAYEKEELAVTKAKERMEDHFKTCHNNIYSVELRWNEEFNTGDCPGCTDFLIGVYECPVHMEHSL
jgi:hypothetical protein